MLLTQAIDRARLVTSFAREARSWSAVGVTCSDQHGGCSVACVTVEHRISRRRGERFVFYASIGTIEIGGHPRVDLPRTNDLVVGVEPELFGASLYSTSTACVSDPGTLRTSPVWNADEQSTVSVSP
jgi:hypothetical protein